MIDPASTLGHSASFDQRRRPKAFQSAMATAFFSPDQNRETLAVVTPMQSRLPCSIGQCWVSSE